MPDRRKGYIQKATIGDHKVYLHTGEYDYSFQEEDKSAKSVLKIWAYEACRLFRDKLAKEDDEQKFDSLLKGVLQADWNSGAFESIANSYYVTLGDSNYTAGGSVMPAFGRKLGYLSPSDWEPLGNLILNHI